MSNQIEKTEKYTFRTLCEEYIVEIPILQREYAQGRKSERKVRKDFVDYLSNKLYEGKAIELDFVYGAMRNDGGAKKVLIPLDGQQRLTTLWLLHWFLAAKEKRVDDVKQVLQNFTYETRPESRSFCKHLLSMSFPVSEINNARSYIADTSWFHEDWHYDATVEGMLTMIGEFEQNKKLLDSKVTLDTLWKQNLITFYFLSLDKFGLTDELYIRMNARGEQLTEFEHFKSVFYITIQGHHLIEEIKTKMESIWVEYLWKYRKKNVYTVDSSFIYFLSFINRMSYYANLEESKEITDFSDLEFISKYFKDTNNVDFLVFALNKLSFLQMISYENILGKISFQDILYKIITDGLEEANMCILLYAGLVYVRQHNEIAPDDENLLNFLRVIRNLIVNTKDKGTREWKRILPTITSLASETDIYQTLFHKKVKIEGFRVDQVEEECFKAQMFVSQPHLKTIIFPIEDHEVLQGQIHNLFAVTYKYDDKNVFELKNHTAEQLNIDFLESIYKCYNGIYNEDKEFNNIWGDLLITSMYETNDWRVFWKEEGYQKHRSIFYISAMFAESKIDKLEEFLIRYEKEKILKYCEDVNGDLSLIDERKKQLFLLYIITRRLLTKDSHDFFRKGYNFGWLEKSRNYQSIFKNHIDEKPIVFQLYNKQFRYNSGIQDDAMTLPEKAPNIVRESFLSKLKDWANKDNIQ